jgi:hypothetical protein
LFFRVLVGRDEVDGFEVAKVDVPAKNVYVQKLSERLVGSSGVKGSAAADLADVFFLVVATEVAICFNVSTP